MSNDKATIEAGTKFEWQISERRGPIFGPDGSPPSGRNFIGHVARYSKDTVRNLEI
jgi:hypothetical protein